MPEVLTHEYIVAQTLPISVYKITYKNGRPWFGYERHDIIGVRPDDPYNKLLARAYDTDGNYADFPTSAGHYYATEAEAAEQAATLTTACAAYEAEQRARNPDLLIAKLKLATEMLRSIQDDEAGCHWGECAEATLKEIEELA